MYPEHDLKNLLENAEYCAKRADYFTMETFLDRADAIAQKIQINIDDYRNEIEKEGYTKSKELLLKSAKIYAKQGETELMDDVLKDAEHCTYKLGKTFMTENFLKQKEEIEKIGYWNGTFKHLEHANKYSFIGHEKEKNQELKFAKKYSDKINIDITPNVALIKCCEKISDLERVTPTNEPKMFYSKDFIYSSYLN